MIAIYPGSFDPITLGHFDIITRSSKLYERVIVVVSRNPAKNPLFTVEERIAQIQKTIQHLNNVEVDSFEGLTVTYAQARQGKVLLRGLRVLSDFEKELQMAHTNKTLFSDFYGIWLFEQQLSEGNC
jgi:pantetheine-phosphate adenylyltransferase